MSGAWYAFLGGLFTYGMTALGAAVVFCFRSVSQKILNAMMGFAAGVMIAASFWSLLAPSLEMSASCMPAIVGFMLGGIFLFAVDRFLPIDKIKSGSRIALKGDQARRSFMLIFAITLHNIPEGMAFGVVFGAAQSNPAMLPVAVAIAIGIGIQNFPEGAAVSIPLRREGLSVGRSFVMGQLSGIVEPIAAVIGALLVVYIEALLPYALAFAAGAMIFVVAEELIPASQSERKGHMVTMGTMLGFAIMMLLDNVL